MPVRQSMSRLLWVAVAILLAATTGVASERVSLDVPDDEFVRVAPDHWSFETSRTHHRFVPFGSSLVLTSKEDLNLFGPRYDSGRYDRILAACEGLRINLLRVFLPIGSVLPDPQVARQARIAPGYLEHLDDFLALCRKHHLRAVIALCEWGGNGCQWWQTCGQYFGRKPLRKDPGVDSLDVLKHFWTILGRRFRDNPTVFAYTPCVEWSFPTSNLTWFPPTVQHGVLPSEQGIWYWRRWLIAKYRSLARLNAAWGTSYRTLDDVPVVDYSYDDEKHRYLDPERKIIDYQSFREWATLRYLRPQIAALRASDPNHLITISNHMRQWDLWEGAARYFMGFTAFDEKPLVDYVTHHANFDESELKNGRTVADMLRYTEVMARFCHAGKPMPMILEEYGFASADPERVAEVQSQMVRATIGHASGWMTWYLQYPSAPNEADAPDRSHQSSWLSEDLSPTLWGKAAALLHEELLRADLSRRPARETLKLDRAAELVPRKLGMLLTVARQYPTSRQPVDYMLTHERDLDVKLQGDR